MKKNSFIQLRASEEQKKIVRENALRNGFSDVSAYLLFLGLSSGIVVETKLMPEVLRVAEAHLGSGAAERKKNVAG